MSRGRNLALTKTCVAGHVSGSPTAADYDRFIKRTIGGGGTPQVKELEGKKTRGGMQTGCKVEKNHRKVTKKKNGQPPTRPKEKNQKRVVVPIVPILREWWRRGIDQQMDIKKKGRDAHRRNKKDFCVKMHSEQAKRQCGKPRGAVSRGALGVKMTRRFEMIFHSSWEGKR